QVSEEFESPIITRREANTIVTVRDGQTIVIGGLISDRFESRRRKVPFFGDIPLIGPLFRSETTNTAKTELLIVLTPYVIDSPTNFDAIESITSESIDALTVPDDVKQKIREHMKDGTGGFFDARGQQRDPNGRSFDDIWRERMRRANDDDQYTYPDVEP
ncbi:MAG: hypothetical protein KC983_12275, partial [Phycisphaerales bacterium]|nr:hypothetical protein [Phycisphaerales bacterium]